MQEVAVYVLSTGENKLESLANPISRKGWRVLNVNVAILKMHMIL